MKKTSKSDFLVVLVLPLFLMSTMLLIDNRGIISLFKYLALWQTGLLFLIAIVFICITIGNVINNG